jgi:COP9 signalosome complex subunit 3
LRKAIEKVQTDPNNNNKIRSNQLTTIHSDLMQLSLAAKNFTLALELMTHEILDINKPQNLSFDPKYFLSYFYYTACVHSAMKQYDSALFYFEQALTIPASALSQIMIEAYKKFLLISLISKGKLPMLPKYTSRIVLNQIKPQCSFYHELASAFMNYDQDKLNSTCQKYHDVFSQDGNLGLIKQLQLAFHKKNIQKLTKTFITLSLTDMANKVKLASVKDAENIMLNMIKDGEIFATINQKDGICAFILLFYLY